MASRTAAATSSARNTSISRRTWTNSRLPCLPIRVPVERDDLRPSITPYLDHEASERKAIYDQKDFRSFLRKVEETLEYFSSRRAMMLLALA